MMEESRSDAEERLRSQVVANSSLKATNTKLTSHIHALNNDITELQAVSHDVVINIVNHHHIRILSLPCFCMERDVDGSAIQISLSIIYDFLFFYLVYLSLYTYVLHYI